MKKMLLMAMSFIASMVFTSCGDSKDATLTPESGTVKGNLKEYFTVVEKPYLVKYDEDGWHHYVISVELQRTDVPFSFDTEGLEPVGTCGTGVYGNFGIGIDVIDADGNMVLTKSPTEGGLSGVYSDDDLKKLKWLENNESLIIKSVEKQLTAKERENKTLQNQIKELSGEKLIKLNTNGFESPPLNSLYVNASTPSTVICVGKLK